jgi:hypothetical protein
VKLFLVPLLFLLPVCNAVGSEIEEPQWRLLDTLESVELRQYEASIQAQTILSGSRETTGGFRRLAGFIFGGNDRSQSIAMTAPVEETLGGSRPVMAFTMPRAYSLEDLPTPDDERVVITEVPERTVAVIRFSGWATGGKVARKTEELLAVLKRHDVEAVGAPSLNQYNPPWTPPFLRRNEVMVAIEPRTLASLP